MIGAGSGIASIATAALGTAGWRNRKSIKNSISNIPTNARNSLSSIRERFRTPTAYQRQIDEVTPTASVAGSRRPSIAPSSATSNYATQGTSLTPSIASSQVESLAGSRRPSNASSTEHNIIDSFFTATGISPERKAPVAAGQRSRSNSESSVFYGNAPAKNLTEQFNNVSPAKTASAKKTQNSEKREVLQRFLQQQGLDTEHRSPINLDLVSGRQSGIQEHTGVSTRNIRAQTGEPHMQFGVNTAARAEARGRGRPRIVPYGPAQRPNQVGRPRTNEYARPIGPSRPRGRPARVQAEEPAPTPPARQSVARNVTKSGKR